MGAELTVDARVRRGSFSLDASFAARPGVTVVTGPSGAGKSTLFDAIAGLLAPERGAIRLGDRVLSDAKGPTHVAPRSRRVGYVFQSLALFPHLSVEKNVGFGIPEGPTKNETVRRWLERMGISRYAGTRPGALSGGERQRVALARALAPGPEILLLDEPFAALDRERRDDLASLVRETARELDVPTLLVTHDPDASPMDARLRVTDGRARSA